MLSRVIFVLGGAASGKSVFAERLVARSGKARVYLATAQALDGEMRAKIDRHINRRGTGWTTFEAPLDPTPALTGLRHDQICLFDCATMWLSNQLLAGNDLNAAQSTLLAGIAACRADLVVVSNEVGHGIVPDNALSRRFRDVQGRLNIALATQADQVVQVTAGLARALKGELP